MRVAYVLFCFFLAIVSFGAPSPGDRIAPFILKSSNGAPFRWKPGRVTVLTICAMWCDTWKDQLPRIKEVQQETRGLPIDFLTILVDGRWADRAHAYPGQTLLSDLGGVWTHELAIDRVPYTLVVRADGRVGYATYGVARSQVITQEILSADRPTTAGDVYLTFDGFASLGSNELLDLLRAENIHATLFYEKKSIRLDSKLVQRATAEGHNLIARSQTRTIKISDNTNFKTNQGQNLFLVDPLDETHPSVDEITRRVLLCVSSACVIRLHIGIKETLLALPKIIENLRSRGFRFETLG